MAGGGGGRKEDEAEEVVGCVSCKEGVGMGDYPEPCKEASIFRLSVKASARGQGVAGMLMEAAETFAMEKGAERIYADTANTKAASCYKKRGYIEDGSVMHLKKDLLISLK